MQETIRTFIALELPREVKSLLQEVQQELKRLKIRARWVRPEINSDDVDKISDALSAAVADITTLTLSVRGIGVFPGIKRPRVIWVGLGGDVQELFALQSGIEAGLDAIGFPKEKRAFKAHLTLGRIKQAVKPDVIRQMMRQYASLSSEEFICDQVTLFKSDLKPSGAVYTPLKHATFR
jgi:2'-5' RNA ligase